MPSTPRLALRPWPTGETGPQSIAEFIGRMHRDRGGFKNVTQDVLQEEIKQEEEALQNSQSEVGADEMDVSSDEAPENEEEQTQILQRSREEVLANIDTAQKMAKQTTDLISLLMTKSPETIPKVQDTLDEGLVKMVGLSTISATRLEDRAPDLERTFDKLTIAHGWRAIGWDKTITSLQAASSRLQNVIKNESRYWTDLVRVKENNWALCNFNKTTAMGVRFGFIDAASQFRKASLAKLPRRLDDGTPRLQTFGTDMNMRLRVTIEKNGQIVGRSSLSPATPDDAPLEARILEARNSVFASELWYELNREARTLLAFNIREQGGVLSFDPPETGRKILISVEYLGPTRSYEPTFPDDSVAESLLRSLQLLLRFYHRQNHSQKFRRKAYHGNPIPAPARAPAPSPNQQNPVYSILRPLLLSARHEYSLHKLLSFLSELVLVLRQVGFSDASYILKTTSAVPPLRPQTHAPSEVSQFTTQFGLIAPRNFRIDLQISPEVRMSIRGQGFAQLGSTQYVITLLPPQASTSISLAAHSHAKPAAGPPNQNPLGDVFPPALPKDPYPTVSEAVYYIRQSVVRVLVTRSLEVANEAAASMAAPDTRDEEVYWSRSVGDTGIKDGSLEREIGVEVLRPDMPLRRGALPGVGGGAAGELAAVDRKYHVAIVLNSVDLQKSDQAKKWVWLPDRSGCQETLNEIVKEAVREGLVP